MRSDKSVTIKPWAIVVIGMLAVALVIIPNLNTDEKVDFNIVGKIYEIEEFQPQIETDGFKTWIERIESFVAISQYSDTVTYRNFHQVNWKIVPERSLFVVRPWIDSSDNHMNLIGDIEIPKDIYSIFLSSKDDSI